jgi:hypothetical protein
MIPTNPLSPPPEKMENPKVQQSKQRILKLIQQFNIDPQKIIQAGKYAQAALKNKKIYPIAIEMAKKEGLIEPGMVQEGVVDYKLLASGITAGKLTQQLIDEGLI